MPERKSSAEEKLRKNGWVRRTTIGEPRLSECVELYKSLGFEVLLEPVILTELDEECRKCYELEGDIGTLKTIYTRPKAGKKKKLEKFVLFFRKPIKHSSIFQLNNF